MTNDLHLFQVMAPIKVDGTCLHLFQVLEPDLQLFQVLAPDFCADTWLAPDSGACTYFRSCYLIFTSFLKVMAPDLHMFQGFQEMAPINEVSMR